MGLFKIPEALKRFLYGHVQSGLRNVSWVALVGIVFSAAPSPVGGYTLQGPHVLELMVQALSTAKTLRVVQKVIVEDKTVTDHSLELKETLSYSFPDRFRSDALFENIHRIHVVTPDDTLTVLDGRRIADPPIPFDRYKDLLLHRSRKSLHKRLLSSGVDVEKTSLGRFGERIVYVIGAQYPDESVSQVMVDKESFLPLRWLNFISANPEERLEFIYGDWQKKGDLWYPMHIELYHNHRLIRQARVVEVQVNAALPSGAFDVAHLKRIHPSVDRAMPPGSPPSPEADELQRTIEDFQKKFSKE